MSNYKILLTGDDGYNSIGTRLLVHALKDKHELHIAGTKNQQTGVGGKLSLKTGGTWGEDTVDGVPAFWAEGTPCDVMECVQGYYKEKFDLLISGVNLGANASSAVISSGTYAAAIRGMGVGLAPRGIAISWDASPELWHKKHDAREDISQYLRYPGDTLKLLMEQCIQEDLWGVPLLNINIPQKSTKTVRFTKILKDISKYYRYPIELDHETHQFSYQRDPFNLQETNERYDVAALAAGHISISPCAFEMSHFTAFERLKDKHITLE